MNTFLLAFVSLAPACDVSASADAAPATAPASAPSWALLLTLWKAEARAQKLPAKHIALYERFMRDAFSRGEICFPFDRADAYRQALRRFVVAPRRCLAASHPNRL